MNQQAQTTLAASVARLRRRSIFVTFVRAELRWLFYTFLTLAIGAAIWNGLQMLGMTPRQNDLPLLTLTFAALGMATFAAALQTWLERPGSVTVAKAWDDSTGGKDRLATAIQLGEAQTPMGRALISEAVETTKRVEPARVFPVRVPREGWLLPLPIGVAIVLSFLPGWINAGPTPDPIVTEALHNQAANIKNFISKERAKEQTPQRKDLLERLDRLATDLSTDKTRKKEALAELAKLMDDMRKDDKEQEKKKLELEKMLKNFQTNDKNRDLTDELNQGKYDDAANRIEKMIDDLKEQIRKKKEEKANKDELDKLEDQLKKAQDVKAQLLKMLQVKLNMKNAKEVMEFLGALEGELGELPDEEIVDGKPGKCLGACSRPATGPIVRLSERSLTKGRKAGRATMTNFFGDEEKRTANQREEHKITIKEQKGKSAFSQTQVANDGSRSKLGAKEILAAEKHAAEDTIERQDIPAGYRDYLRKYFDGIQPDDSAEKDTKNAKDTKATKAGK